MTHHVSSNQRGFSLVEMLGVIVIIGMMASIALPRTGVATYKANSGAQVIASTLTYAQRQAISRQTDTRVAFDVANNELRIHEDANNDNVIDLVERVSVTPLPEGVTFGRGTAAARTMGAAVVNFTRTQGAASDRDLPAGRQRQRERRRVCDHGCRSQRRSHRRRACGGSLPGDRAGIVVFLRHRSVEGRPLMERRGFTLIEVMLAVVILGIVLVSVARYNSQFLHTVSTSSVRTVAADVARERISLVDMDPSYTTLGRHVGRRLDRFSWIPRMRRVTTVSRITGSESPARLHHRHRPGVRAHHGPGH